MDQKIGKEETEDRLMYMLPVCTHTLPDQAQETGCVMPEEG